MMILDLEVSPIQCVQRLLFTKNMHLVVGNTVARGADQR